MEYIALPEFAFCAVSSRWNYPFIAQKAGQLLRQRRISTTFSCTLPFTVLL